MKESEMVKAYNIVATHIGEKAVRRLQSNKKQTSQERLDVMLAKGRAFDAKRNKEIADDIAEKVTKSAEEKVKHPAKKTRNQGTDRIITSTTAVNHKPGCTKRVVHDSARVGDTVAQWMDACVENDISLYSAKVAMNNLVYHTKSVRLK